MSYADIANQEIDALPTGSAIYEKGFGDITSSTIASAVSGLPMMSDYLKGRQRSDRNSAINERFGVDYSGEAKKAVTKGDFETYDDYDSRLQAEQQRLTDEFIKGRRATDPESVSGIKTTEEINNLVVSARQNADIDAERDFEARSSDLAGYGGLAFGSIVGTMTDPVNAASLLVGAGPLMSFRRAVMFEGGVGAGVETLQTPENKRWAEEVGYQYGLGDAAANIAFAGAGGAGFTAVARGTGKVLSAVRGKSYEVLDGVANDKALPSAERDAAKYQANAAHIDEGTPLERSIATAEEVAINRQNLREVQDAIEFGREPNIDDSIFPDRMAREIDPEAFAILDYARSRIDALRRERVSLDAESPDVLAVDKRILELEARLERADNKRKRVGAKKALDKAVVERDELIAARVAQPDERSQELVESILNLERQAADASVRANKALKLAREQLPSEIAKMQGVSQKYKDAQNLEQMNQIAELEARIAKKPEKADIYQAQIDSIRADMNRAPEMLAPAAENPVRKKARADESVPARELAPEDINRLIDEVEPTLREQPIIDDMGRTDTADPMRQIEDSIPTPDRAVEAFDVDSAEFQRILDESPDKKILIPDAGGDGFRNVSIREVYAIMEEDDAVAKAVSFCGVGR